MVRELYARWLEQSGPSTIRERRFLGMSLRYTVSGDPRVLDFSWSEPNEATAEREGLGLTDDGF